MNHIIGTIAVIIILLCCSLHYAAKRQADVFNKICQPIVKVTASDAFWVDLKVGSCVIGNHRDE